MLVVISVGFIVVSDNLPTDVLPDISPVLLEVDVFVLPVVVVVDGDDVDDEDDGGGGGGRGGDGGWILASSGQSIFKSIAFLSLKPKITDNFLISLKCFQNCLFQSAILYSI